MTPKPESVDLTRLPWLALTERSHLPTTSAVYFVVSQENRVLYVGSTENLRHRFKTHHRMFDFCKFRAEKIYYQLVKPDHISVLRTLESAYKDFLKPMLNVV